MESLGEASYFLGLEIEKSGGYFVFQKGYAARSLTHFRMGESNEHTYGTMPEVNQK